MDEKDLRIQELKEENRKLREKLKALMKQPRAEKWIPIGQFPEEPCLLDFGDGIMAVGYYDAFADVCICVDAGYYLSEKEPVAWQPLPQAYKKEGVE